MVDNLCNDWICVFLVIEKNIHKYSAASKLLLLK